MDINQHDKTSEAHVAQSFINVRCPGCFKLYSVKNHEITEEKPKFKCNACPQFFWIKYPDCLGPEEVLGYPETVTDNAAQKEVVPEPKVDSVKEKINFHLDGPMDFVEVEKFGCPKCDSLNEVGKKECRTCGIFFDKFGKSKESKINEIEASEYLKNHWNAVMENYDKDVFHEDFLSECLKAKKLDFAASRYAKVLSAYSGDRSALKMVERIQKMAMAQTGVNSKLPSANVKKRFRWSFMLVSIGIAMILIGYFIPQLRNMVGVGVAMTFLTMAVRFYFK